MAPLLTPVAIAGMHRSGTSMIAQVLHHCGLDLGPADELAEPKPDNADGFWENLRLQAINDEILASAGGAWDEPPPFPVLSETTMAVRARALAIFGRFDPERPWGWKDPRNSLTIDFWQHVFPDLRVVICVRNPLEVAASLHLRNFFSIQRGLSLWYAYNARLLNAVPRERRIVTHYESFFSNGAAEVERLCGFIGLQFGGPEELAQVLPAVKRDLRHHAYTTAELCEAELSDEMVQLYTTLCSEADRIDDVAILRERPEGPPRTVPINPRALELVNLRREATWLRRQMSEGSDQREQLRAVAEEHRRVAVENEVRTESLRAERDALVQRLEATVEAAARQSSEAAFTVGNLTKKVEQLESLMMGELRSATRELLAIVPRERATYDEYVQHHSNLLNELSRRAAEERAALESAGGVLKEFRSVLTADQEQQAALKELAGRVAEERIELARSVEASLEELRAALNAGREQEAVLATLVERVAEERALLGQSMEAVMERVGALSTRNANQPSALDPTGEPRSHAGYGATFSEHAGSAPGADHELLTERLAAAQRERLNLRLQLASIHSSRLWKFGSAYWRLLKLLRLDLNGAHPVNAEVAPLYCERCAALLSESEVATVVEPIVARGSEAAELARAARPADKYDVICFPIIDWDFRYQRPQQLMGQFALEGRRVFYISQKLRASGPPYELRQVRPNVWEVSLHGPARNVYTERLTPADADSLFVSVDAMRRDLGIAAAVSVLQLPFWRAVAEIARERHSWPIVYDCMDHHAGFDTGTDAAADEEIRLLKSADLVTVSSSFLEKAAQEHAARVVMVRNGCDYEHFARVGSIERGPRPVIGYYGAIADWFDTKLVGEMATLRPEWDFVLVGSTYLADLDPLSGLSNVELVGEKPYAEIPEWLERFDVAIIPFKRTPLTEATNPVKVYEMLAGGKPVVSVPIPEVEMLREHVRLASTPTDFIRQIEEALERDGDSTRAARRRFASQQTWAHRHQTFAAATVSAFPKVTIAIVTYNNLELNRACIESLFGTLDWPNAEVIVVDNASSDGTPAYLRRAAEEHPQLQVILNATNRGFAAANNQALQIATGDVLILLNNDTVVPRGWIWSLVRHLRADPEIGLIGPSTNAIGNEGMIEVGYEDIAEMPAWAEAHVAQHEGEIFDIPMLAMFCVAMRREVFEKVGYLDEQFGVGMFEDDDYAERMRGAGYRVVCARDAFVHHWMKAAFGKIPEAEYQALFRRNRDLFERKWGRSWVPHAGA